ncbi:MAG: thioredoxin fold domain-containing protein [Xanthomonadales bacterium]|nr:thioredoxin fold domain-containing protein [Xanthomonadales bacterium]
MKKSFLALLLLLSGGLAQAADDYPEVRAAMQGLLPHLSIDSIRPAPFAGFVEVLLGAHVVYVSTDGQYLLNGQLIEVASRRNLSEDARSVVRKARLEEVAAEQRFVFPADGEPKHRLVIFTDIDCGYCRRLHQQIGEYQELGIEVSYLLFPRAGIGSHSHEKAVSVWCADDRNEALTAAKAGEEPEPLECPNPIDMHFALGKELGVTGTPAMVAEDGTLIPGYIPPGALLQQLDALAAASAE